jgi:hypothetical protein
MAAVHTPALRVTRSSKNGITTPTGSEPLGMQLFHHW